MEEAGQWYLILPASREKVPVHEDYEQYLNRIDPELRKKLRKQSADSFFRTRMAPDFIWKHMGNRFTSAWS